MAEEKSKAGDAKPEKLDRWEMAIVHLARGCSIKQTGKLTGIGHIQLKSRLKTEAFQERIAAHRKEACERSAAILEANQIKAAKTLAELLKSKSENMQFKAAVAILESGKTQQEIRDSAEEQAMQGTLLRPDDDARAMDETIPKVEKHEEQPTA